MRARLAATRGVTPSEGQKSSLLDY